MSSTDVFTTSLKHMDITEEQLRYEIFDLELPIRQIAKKYNCNRGCLDRLVRKWNIQLPLSRLEILLTKERLEEDLRAGLTIKQMAKNYKCGLVVLKKRIKEYDLSWLSGAGGSAQIRNLKIQGVVLTEKQRSIVIGSILGDGYITRNKSKATGQAIGNANIEFCQTADRKDYLLWKAEEMQPFIRNIYQDKKYLTYYANTVNYHVFNEFYDVFIKDGKKSIPIDIVNYLNELVLAIWVQDDGRTESYWSNLCTQGFTEEENHILAKALEDKFNLITRVKIWKGSKGNLYYLRFDSSEHKKLHTIVDPLFHPCFEYKKFKK